MPVQNSYGPCGLMVEPSAVAPEQRLEFRSAWLMCPCGSIGSLGLPHLPKAPAQAFILHLLSWSPSGLCRDSKRPGGGYCVCYNAQSMSFQLPMQGSVFEHDDSCRVACSPTVDN